MDIDLGEAVNIFAKIHPSKNGTGKRLGNLRRKVDKHTFIFKLSVVRQMHFHNCFYPHVFNPERCVV